MWGSGVLKLCKSDFSADIRTIAFIAKCVGNEHAYVRWAIGQLGKADSALHQPLEPNVCCW